MTEICFIDSKGHWVRIIVEEDIKKMLPIVLQQKQWIITVDSRVQSGDCHLTVVADNYKEVHAGICMTNHCNHHQVFNDKDVSNNNNNKDNVNNNNSAQQTRQSISTSLYKKTNHEIHNKSNQDKEHNAAKRTSHDLITTETTNNCLETCLKIMKHWQKIIVNYRDR